MPLRQQCPPRGLPGPGAAWLKCPRLIGLVSVQALFFFFFFFFFPLFLSFLATQWHMEFLGQGSDPATAVIYAAAAAIPEPLTHCAQPELNVYPGADVLIHCAAEGTPLCRL